jgi:hypothetical protein
LSPPQHLPAPFTHVHRHTTLPHVLQLLLICSLRSASTPPHVLQLLLICSLRGEVCATSRRHVTFRPSGILRGRSCACSRAQHLALTPLSLRLLLLLLLLLRWRFLLRVASSAPLWSLWRLQRLCRCASGIGRAGDGAATTSSGNEPSARAAAWARRPRALLRLLRLMRSFGGRLFRLLLVAISFSRWASGRYLWMVCEWMCVVRYGWSSRWLRTWNALVMFMGGGVCVTVLVDGTDWSSVRCCTCD